ncbi:hypothetical protein APR09_000646 [Nocardia amikacinitolerans]|nr:hypothetical protein [Nocardia amikacinitolerans]
MGRPLLQKGGFTGARTRRFDVEPGQRFKTTAQQPITRPCGCDAQPAELSRRVCRPTTERDRSEPACRGRRRPRDACGGYGTAFSLAAAAQATVACLVSFGLLDLEAAGNPAWVVLIAVVEPATSTSGQRRVRREWASQRTARQSDTEAAPSSAMSSPRVGVPADRTAIGYRGSLECCDGTATGRPGPRSSSVGRNTWLPAVDRPWWRRDSCGTPMAHAGSVIVARCRAAAE